MYSTCLYQHIKALVKSFVEEVFNNHDISATEKYFAKENPPIGSEGFKQSLSAQFKELFTS
jgi:hypothetical protein